VPLQPLSRHLKALLKGVSAQVARDGFLAAIDQGTISLTNFLAALFLARSVSPTEFGVYSVGFLLLHMIRSVQQGLIVQPVSVFGPIMDECKFKRYASASGVIMAGLAIISAAITAGAGRLLTATGNDTLGPMVFSLWFVFLFWGLQEYVRRLFYARGVINRAVVNTVIASLIRLVVLWWLYTQGQLSGIDGMHAIAWGALIALPIGIWQAREYWTLREIQLLTEWKRNWSFGRWMLGGMLGTWIAQEVYPILTAGMISFAAAGAYRALQTVLAPVHALLAALDPFLTPQASKIFHRSGRHGLSRMMTLCYLFFGVPILGFLIVATFFSQPLLSLFYGSTYLAFSRGLLLMSIFYILRFLYFPLQVALKALKKSLPIFIGNIAAIVSMFTIGVWAITQWNIYGAIAGQALNAAIITAE
jgi:O-antigen/teichoic acid export membrane protein